MKKVFIHQLYILVLLVSGQYALAQSSTINTEQMATSGYTSNTSAGSGGTAYITFAVENNSGTDIKLTEVGRYTTTAYNGTTSTLYYSATELSGSPGTLPTSNWTLVDQNTVSGITASAINPVNVNMSFIIPDGAIYRFALLTTGTNTYSSSGDPNSFTVNGVSLYCGNYQINGSNVGYGATNTPRYFRGSITFEPACDAKITAAPTAQNVCAGTKAVFNGAASDAQAYSWEVNTGTGWNLLGDDAIYSGTSTNQMTINSATQSMHGNNYRMIATNTTSSCSVISDFAPLNIVGSGSANIGINASTGKSICTGQEVLIQSYFTNGGSSPRFGWFRNGVEIPGETGGVLKINNLNDNDVITSVLYSNALCVAPTTSNPLSFDVESILQSAVSLTSQFNGDGTHTFTATPQNGGANPRYYWLVNGNVVPGENGDTYTTSDLNPYDRVSVSMRSDLPCAQPAVASSNTIATSIDDISAGKTFNIAPNPNNGTFVINATNSNLADKQLAVTITNMVGQVVYTQTVTTSPGNLSIPVTLPAGAPNGIYTVNIIAENEPVSIRFVLNR